ncbi:MAG: acyltransferase [Pseudobdellovibrionaceae bacterium]
MFSLIRGISTALLFALNCLLWCGLIYILVLLKLLLPMRALKEWCSRQMVFAAENWISCNSTIFKVLHTIQWRAEGIQNLKAERSYLVCSNHVSGTDIVALQEVFNRRIPFMRFFIKQQLRYVPLLGLAWQALDFPMMKRHSADYLLKYPEKRGEDLATTKQSCAKLRGKRISIMNFMEGTRLTPIKHSRQQSPFKNLLKPKVGGLAYVLEAMGDQFHSLLDVTVYYPRGTVSVWGLMCGRMTEVIVHVREVEIPTEFSSRNYLGDLAYRTKIHDWVQELWAHKDLLLTEMIAAAGGRDVEEVASVVHTGGITCHSR